MVVMDGEEFLTAQEACAILEIKPATLYAYVSRGMLGSYRQGIKRTRLGGIFWNNPRNALEARELKGVVRGGGKIDRRVGGGGRARRSRHVVFRSAKRPSVRLEGVLGFPPAAEEGARCPAAVLCHPQ